MTTQKRCGLVAGLFAMVLYLVVIPMLGAIGFVACVAWMLR